MKYIAVVACIIMAVMMVAPIAPVHARNIGAVMNTIQYQYFNTEAALYASLVAGTTDVYGWTLSQAEYAGISANTAIVVEPLSEAGEFEISFNNNVTDGVHMSVRSPTNYTDFRNAMNCLVDEDFAVNDPAFNGGFAARDYTQVPNPLETAYQNPSVSGSNYPWAINVTHALQILWNGNWYNKTLYNNDLNQLVLTVQNGSMLVRSSAYGLVYPGTDQNDQGWGQIDTNTSNTSFGVNDGPTAYTIQGVAGNPIQPLEGYYRTGDARKDLGLSFINNLKAIGCPHNDHPEATLTALRPYVIDAQTYDWATVGYGTMSAPPLWYYSECTPSGITAGGPNSYLIQDTNMTYWATTMFTASTQAAYTVALMAVQDILVMESMLVSGYTPLTYCAYRTGLLSQIDTLGSATEGGGQSYNWISLDSRKTNTINYTGSPAGTPASNIIYYGCYNPPDMINPIFGDEVFDFQVMDEIFTYPYAGNPYTILPGSAITNVTAGGDLPWMAYCWNTTLINNPANPGSYDAINYPGQWTNVTLWFRNDITWQDGAPFNVSDVNYTIYTMGYQYFDAYDHSSMTFMINRTTGAPLLTAWGPYTCSILVKSPSWLNLYMPSYEYIPEHLYKYIVPSNPTAASVGVVSDGLHGLWPGQAPANTQSGNINGSAPFTISQVQNDPIYTLVGTGPWEYREGSNTGFVLGGGITLDRYSNITTDSGFFLTPSPGAIAFKYTWANCTGTEPQAGWPMPQGGYYKVGLSDLVYLASSYSYTGTPPSSVPISEVPGQPHSWNPAADLAGPSGVVGLSDLVTLALHYGWYYGNYSYNAPYPASEIAYGLGK